MTVEFRRTSPVTTHRRETVCTIPAPTPRTYSVCTVSSGARSWTVVDYGDDIGVMCSYDPRARRMRRCGLRDRIVAAARSVA